MRSISHSSVQGSPNRSKHLVRRGSWRRNKGLVPDGFGTSLRGGRGVAGSHTEGDGEADCGDRRVELVKQGKEERAGRVVWVVAERAWI